MNFLLPLAGWLGLLAIPIIGFYILKTRQRRKQVSTLLFWEALAPKVEQTPFWRRLRRWVSLAIQLLILALLIAALARPAFEWEQSAPRRIVALIDPSASMEATVTGGKSGRQHAREAVLQAIDQLRAGDEMALLSLHDAPRILHGWTSSRRALREAIAALEPLSGGSDPRPALELARELALLRENAEIAIFSDTIWPARVEEALQREGPPVRLIRHDAANPAINAGITHFAIRRSPVAPGDWQLDLEATSPNGFEGMVELRRDDQPMDLASFKIEPGGLWQKSWRGHGTEAARFTAILRASGDDQLTADNTATAQLPPLRPLRILYTGKADLYLEALLGAIPLVEWSHRETYPSALPEGMDLVIATGDQLPDSGLPPEGPALLLIAPARNGFWGERKGTLAEAPVSDQQREDRLLRHVSFGPVAIRAAGEWTPPQGSASLVASLGHPLIFGQWDRTPRWLVVGFDPAESDLPLRTAFPILIGNLLESLRPEDPTGESAATLPGVIESRLQPLSVQGGDAMAKVYPAATASWWPVLPGWWWVALLALVALVAEWGSFHRRMTD